MHLGDEIGDGELQAVGEPAQRFVLRREAEFRPEIEEDVGHMRDDQRAVLQERRREGDVRFGCALHERHHLIGAATGLARDVDIVRAGLFQRQPHEFSAPLDAVPVVKFVGHGVLDSCRGWRYRLAGFYGKGVEVG